MLRLDRMAMWGTVRLFGIVLTAAVIVGWGYVLLAPIPSAPAAHLRSEAAADPAERQIVDWLTPGPLKIEVHSSGLIAAGDWAVAVLSVNGRPAQPYRVGDQLAEAVVVKSVDRDAVVIDKAGEIVRIAVPALAALPAGGITRAPLTK